MSTLKILGLFEAELNIQRALLEKSLSEQSGSLKDLTQLKKEKDAAAEAEARFAALPQALRGAMWKKPPPIDPTITPGGVVRFNMPQLGEDAQAAMKENPKKVGWIGGRS